MTERALWSLMLTVALGIPVGTAAQVRTAAPPASAPAAVDVSTTLDRTAAWIGDRITYTVELRSRPNFDIILEDLAADRLHLDGGEVLGVAEDHEPLDTGTVRRVRYTLVANRPEVTSLRIQALVVRYYQRGDAGAQGAPAGQVVVPAAAVSIRSTLPDGGTVAGPRSPTALRRAPQWLRMLGPIGIILIVVTILPVLLYILKAGPRARAGWSRIKALRERRRRRRAFADVKDLTPASESDRVAAFGRLDAFVRDHLEGNAGVPAQALTPGELRHALAVRGGDAFAPESVERLLDACERARYAPSPPSHSEWTDAVRDAEEILRHRRR